jgi:hypothetical protein
MGDPWPDKKKRCLQYRTVHALFTTQPNTATAFAIINTIN